MVRRYAPPEQLDKGVVFAHSDLYALAATAIVLLTGKRPQQLIDFYTCQWNWQAEVTLSPKLEWVLAKMLAPDPCDRFGSATEVINTLRDISVVAPATKLWGGEVNWRTAMAYDATQALIAAIARHPTRIGIQKALGDPNFATSGAGGQVRFAPSGDRLNSIELVEIQASESDFNYEFSPINRP